MDCDQRKVICALCKDSNLIMPLSRIPVHQHNAMGECKLSKCSDCLFDQYGVGHVQGECTRDLAGRVSKGGPFFGVTYPELFRMVGENYMSKNPDKVLAAAKKLWGMRLSGM